MIPEKYKGQVIVDIAAFLILFIILIIHYGYTKPQEFTLKRKLKKI
jgi:hypothetical protein